MEVSRSTLGGVTLAVAMALATAGCGEDRVVEGDSDAAYRRVFDEPVPAGVDVVHSVLWHYAWRLGQVTTDDWEIELIAPRRWIETTRDDLALAPLEASNTFVARHVADRMENRRRPWYAPGSIEDYEVFYLRATSVPYVHMLAAHEPLEDGRFRVFLSKH